MKIDLLDIDSFIKGNKIKEVTASQFFINGNEPNPRGVFSTEIFGTIGSQERNKNFGYINLRGNFIHPVVFKALRRVFRGIDQLASGEKFYSIDGRGELYEDEKTGKTGLEWLYKNWDKIRFKSTDSEKRKAYLSLLSLPKERIWINTFLISPASNRDYQMKGTSGHMRMISETSEVNDMYAKILRMSNSIDSGDEANFTRYQIQLLILDLYDYFISDIKGKQGLIQKGVMTKTVDYATRSVVTTPKIQSSSYSNMQIKFGYFGIPLAQLTVLFLPFYVKWIREWAEEYEEELSTVGSNANKHHIDNVLDQFDEFHIQKLLERFTEAPEDRFKELQVLDNNGRSYPINIYSNDLHRNLTITDIIYIATNDIVPEKHVYVTRYPIENINNIAVGRIKVLSTLNTVKEQKIADKYLPDYPIIIPNYPIDETSTVFYDTVIPHTSMAGAFGMDFDGDELHGRHGVC